MSDKRTTANAPPQPNYESLPKPKLVWQGECGYLGSATPCRIVLAYSWVLGPQDKDWTAEAQTVFERVESCDSLGSQQWKRAELKDIPATFYEAVLARFQQS